MTCAYLGYAQGWWSVVGLVIEIAGFVILSIDISREYSRFRKVELFRDGAKAAREELARRAEGTDDAAILSRLKESGASQMAIDLAALELTLGRANARLAWLDSLSRKERNDTHLKMADLETIASELPRKADFLEARKFRPAPIRVGIALVLCGASMQIVGSWPCS